MFNDTYSIWEKAFLSAAAYALTFLGLAGLTIAFHIPSFFLIGATAVIGTIVLMAWSNAAK